MAKATWVNVGGVWKNCTAVWRNTGGVWASGGTPWRNISSVWKDCFAYDSVSLSASPLEIYGAGVSNNITVTSSSNWTATKTSDSSGAIATFTSSGSNGGTLSVVSTFSLGDGAYNATIRVTVGSVYADLDIWVYVGEG